MQADLKMMDQKLTMFMRSMQSGGKASSLIFFGHGALR